MLLSVKNIVCLFRPGASIATTPKNALFPCLCVGIRSSIVLFLCGNLVENNSFLGFFSGRRHGLPGLFSNAFRGAAFLDKHAKKKMIIDSESHPSSPARTLQLL